MVLFQPETLTILVLIAVILAGVTFIAVSILIIYLICIRYCTSNRTTNDDSLSTIPSVSDSNRSSPVPSSSSIRSTPIKAPVVTIPKKKQPPPSTPLTDYHSDRITVIDEVSSDDEIKHKQIKKQDKIYSTTIRNDNRVNTQHYMQRRQQREKPIKPITDVRVIDRHTPYPTDVLQRERYMVANRGFQNTPYDQQ
ncbi:unnamed protein product [Rotaria sordida]|uniref:Uncharacterized protein n=1 Tax=Rotaria sordida TaxID=392033 RepID=A0A815S4H5_9BILA|nr:unnamed protein product [Rotaria sordida]CAF1217769.1 unnamed protein product [Rotaria sordida]CAF1484561.1 unnamed protein product [Rotaria sordida]CAF1484761.1 unnamed protein product [Rotaria sordida]CAF3720758.1 unnamed protein product [Rotaria sordida]